MRQVIYTDGSCYPNNGKGNGGWSCVYENEQGSLTIDFSYIPNPTTNNIAELLAVTHAVTKFPLALIKSDSQYVVNGFNTWMANWATKGWKKVKNVQLWQDLYILKKDFNGELTWVKAHNGIFMNELADAGANYARMSRSRGTAILSQTEGLDFISEYSENLTFS